MNGAPVFDTFAAADAVLDAVEQAHADYHHGTMAAWGRSLLALWDAHSAYQQAIAAADEQHVAELASAPVEAAPESVKVRRTRRTKGSKS